MTIKILHSAIKHNEPIPGFKQKLVFVCFYKTLWQLFIHLQNIIEKYE